MSWEKDETKSFEMEIHVDFILGILFCHCCVSLNSNKLNSLYFLWIHKKNYKTVNKLGMEMGKVCLTFESELKLDEMVVVTIY